MSSTPILDAMRAERLKTLDKKYKQSEAHAKRAIAEGEVAKRIRSTDPEVVLEATLSELYYSMSAAYHGRTNFRTAKPGSNRALWKKVVARCTESGVGSLTFMKAQFDYFDTAFGCVPLLPSLTTEKAVERAQAYTGTATRIVASGINVKSDKAEVLQYYDKLIRDVCKAHKISKEIFYKDFVQAGQMSIAEAYLAACPVWKKVSGK